MSRFLVVNSPNHRWAPGERQIFATIGELMLHMIGECYDEYVTYIDECPVHVKNGDSSLITRALEYVRPRELDTPCDIKEIAHRRTILKVGDVDRESPAKYEYYMSEGAG